MITDEELRKWRREADGAMHSAVDEYCPKDEFFALLDEVEVLREKLELAQRRIAALEERGGAWSLADGAALEREFPRICDGCHGVIKAEWFCGHPLRECTCEDRDRYGQKFPRLPK